MRSHLLLVVFFPFLLATVASCGDDSTVPQETGPPTFSRLMGGLGSETYANDVVITSTGLRIVVGGFDGTMHVTGSSDSLVASGSGEVFLAAFREDGTVAWLQQAGGGSGYVAAFHVSRDASDNLYIAGGYAGNATFGATNLTGGGQRDLFVAKVDGGGNPIWASGTATTGDDRAFDIATATDGGVLVCGDVSSETKVLGEDVGEFGSAAGFLVRGQANGVGNWSQSASGTGSAICYGVARSGDGTILVCGTYGGADVEIGGEILPLEGSQGSFVARFTDDGAPAGVVRMGGTGGVIAYRLTTVGDEPVVAGIFSGAVDFDVDTSAGSVTSAGYGDAFVARYGEDGALLWVKRFGTGGEENGLGICRIGSNGFFLAGTFNGSLPLGSQVLQSAGGLDFFLARLDDEGNVRSSSQISGPLDELIIAVTSVGETAVVAGSSPGSLSFPDGSQRSPRGVYNGFIYQE